MADDRLGRHEVVVNNDAFDLDLHFGLQMLEPLQHALSCHPRQTPASLAEVQDQSQQPSLRWDHIVANDHQLFTFEGKFNHS